ncbi:MAG: hypothetical protein HYZ32_00785, partial [Hydrocarboniphaga effusa]|nr:hypothetical protein [Hydrocarboniphaga effusa]
MRCINADDLIRAHANGSPVKTSFQRIERLPPYVFNIVGDLKKTARAR